MRSLFEIQHQPRFQMYFLKNDMLNSLKQLALHNASIFSVFFSHLAMLSEYLYSHCYIWKLFISISVNIYQFQQAYRDKIVLKKIEIYSVFRPTLTDAVEFGKVYIIFLNWNSVARKTGSVQNIFFVYNGQNYLC